MRLIVTLWLFLFAISAKSQDVNIPNVNFKNKLLSANSSNQIARNLSNAYFKIDANSDGQIQVSEAQQVSWLDIADSNILNLQGIEAFTSLKYLDFVNNFVSSADLGALTFLEELRCGANELNTLDVSTNTNLKVLLCEGNHLTSLNVSALANLEVLNCGSNLLTSLTIGNLDNLIYLTCNVNNLTSLDASGLASLKNVECSHNNLVSLNVSGSTQIEDLRCNSNNLTSIDVTTLGNLHVLDVSVNDLTAIDLSNQVLLETFWCIYNEFTTLNLNNSMFLDFLDIRFCENLVSLYIKNGSNELVQPAVNLALNFICCDENEVTYIENLGGIPQSAIVTTDCQLSVEETDLRGRMSYPNPVNGQLYFNPQFQVRKIEVYDMAGRMLLAKSTSENRVEIDDLSDGTYIVRIYTPDAISFEKIIVRN